MFNGELLGQLYAVHVGHNDVRQEQMNIALEFTCFIQGFERTQGCDRTIPPAPKQASTLRSMV